MANFGTYRGGEIISQGVSRALDRHQRQKEVDLNEAYRRDTLKENTRQFEENLKINKDRNEIAKYEHGKQVALDNLNNTYLSDLFSQDGNIYNQGDFVGPDGSINSHGWAKLKESVNMNALDAYTKWTGDKTKVSLADFEVSYAPYRQNVIQKAFAQITGDLASQGDGYGGFEEWMEKTGQKPIIPDDPTTDINESMNIKQIYQMATGKELGADPAESGKLGTSLADDLKPETYNTVGGEIKYLSTREDYERTDNNKSVGQERNLIVNAIKQMKNYEQGNIAQTDNINVIDNGDGTWTLKEEDLFDDDEITVYFDDETGMPYFNYKELDVNAKLHDDEIRYIDKRIIMNEDGMTEDEKKIMRLQFGGS